MSSLNAVGYLIGAGSMSLGVEWAGFKLQAIHETPGYGKNARTWDLNRPDLLHRTLELDDLGSVPGADGVDLIYGNPPCGGLSTMTGGHLESKTNRCMVQWSHMVVKNRPRMILMENAYQIATDRALPLLQELKAIYNDAGYYMWTWQFYSWQLGCPQTRRRAFICASVDKPREDLVTLSDLPKDYGDMRVMDWIWDLADVEPSPDPVKTAKGEVVTDHWWDPYSKRISDYLVPYHYIALNKQFMTPKQADMWRNSDTPKEREEYRKRCEQDLFWVDCPKVFEGMQQFRRPHTTHKVGPAHTVLSDFRLVHPEVLRLMTMRECARLTGYPDQWKFHETKAYLLAQGVPSFNSRWAADRLAKAVGLR